MPERMGRSTAGANPAGGRNMTTATGTRWSARGKEPSEIVQARADSNRPKIPAQIVVPANGPAAGRIWIPEARADPTAAPSVSSNAIGSAESKEIGAPGTPARGTANRDREDPTAEAGVEAAAEDPAAAVDGADGARGPVGPLAALVTR